ncbi:MAG: DUF4294 domain-containing protein [Bacteroidia bacterium]
MAQEVRVRVVEYNGMIYGDGYMEEIEMLGKKPTLKEMKNAQKHLEKWEKLRKQVHKLYPYAVGVAEVWKEAETKTAQMSSAEGRVYLKQREKELFAKYEADVKKMTTKQGKILLKLIYRQSGNSMFDLVKDVKNGFTASFWQGAGFFFNINLKEGLDMDREEDMWIEQFSKELDCGGFNTYYQQANYKLAKK